MKNKSLITDFTHGSIPKQLFFFSIPFMLSNALQVLYSLIDMMIVGKFVGSAGLSAVSVSSQIFTFMTMFCLGFSNGGQVLIARCIGSGEKEKISCIIGSLTAILLAVGVTVSALGLAFSKSLLKILNTPDEAFSMAYDYAVVCSMGILFTFGYNMISSVLRGMGDSRHPFLFILIASVVNIAGDFILVGYANMGIKGAATATILGQAVSFVISLAFLTKKRKSFEFDTSLSAFRPRRTAVKKLCKLGIPFAVQSCAVNISMMFVNRLVNQVGVYASAVFGVGIKIDDIVNKITQGIAFACSTIVSQNVGAKQYKRTKTAVYANLVYCGICYTVFAVVFLTASETLFRFFTDDPNVIQLSHTFASAVVWGFPAMVLLRSGLGFIRGIGNAKLGLILGVTDAFVFRIGLSYLLGIVFHMGLFGFFFGYAFAAIGTGVPAMIYFWSGKWKKYKI